MSSRIKRYDPHQIYVRKVRKLQSKGLIGDVDLRKKPSPAIHKQLEKYRDVLTGKATAVKVPDRARARELRSDLNARGRGNVVVVPKESKTERITYSRREGKIIGKRPGYRDGETIKRTYGERLKARPVNAKAYYILPERRRGLGKLKRKVFASFDELLYYLNSYDINFEDVEDIIEIEEVERNSVADEKIKARISRERAAAIKKKDRQSRYKRR